jgi:transposase InsO family protein
MVIKESRSNLSIEKKVLVLGVNRSSYYNWLNGNPKEVDPFEGAVIQAYHEHRGTYGRLRIALKLNQLGMKINHKRVYRIMKKHRLQAIIRKKFFKREYSKEHVVKNLLNREFSSKLPLTKLVSDITELKKIAGQKYFFYSVMDLFNNEIVSSALSTRNDWELVKSGLKKGVVEGALMHTDQGKQFTSLMYKKYAEENNLTLSMSRVGNCYDNAAKESFFGHFKEEFYIYHNPQNEEELRQDLDDFIRYYNEERIQMRLKCSPVEYSLAHVN